MAADIKAKTGVPGFSIPTMGNAGGWRFTPVAWAYGVEFMKQDENGKWKATFNTQECLDALQWIYDLKWKYDCIQADVLQDNAKERNAFGAGAAAMCFAEGASTSTFLQGGMAKEDLGFIQMPAGPARHVTLIGGGYNVFNSKATDEQIDAAFEFLDWTGNGRRLDDDVKQNMVEKLQTRVDEGELIGVINASPYNANDAKRAYEIEVNLNTPENGGFRNVPLEQVALYNQQALPGGEGTDNPNAPEWQQEEPVEAQALYQCLEAVIQACLTEKDVDIAKQLKDAEAKFQIILDNSISNK
jgi:ABC-type glycerol-3-phosphate transport system substrate-binding protein